MVSDHHHHHHHQNHPDHRHRHHRHQQHYHRHNHPHHDKHQHHHDHHSNWYHYPHYYRRRHRFHPVFRLAPSLFWSLISSHFSLIALIHDRLGTLQCVTRPSVWRAEKSKTLRWLRPLYAPIKIGTILQTQDSTTRRGTGDRGKIRVENGCKLTSSNEWPWHELPHRGSLTKWRNSGWRHTSCRLARRPCRGNITKRTDKIRCKMWNKCKIVYPV